MVRAPHLLMIDPSIHVAESEGTDEVIAGWSGTSRVLLPALTEVRMGDVDPSQAAGVVVMGSAASVHDDSPWLEGLRRFLEPILTGEIVVPTLGICFGHQLLAHCLGAVVEFVHPDRRKELGLRSTQFAGSRLFADGQYSVVASHNELVTQLPSSLHAVAARDLVAVDAFEHRSLPLFGVQFHPEAREQFAQRRGFDLGLHRDAVRRDGQRVMGAFRELAQANQAG